MIVAQKVREFLGVSAVGAACTKKLSLGNRIIREPGSQVASLNGFGPRISPPGFRDIASARAEPLPWKHRTTKMFGMPPEHHGSVRVAERPGRCGNCAHPAPSLERGWIERCLRFAPQPARCAEILVMDHYTGAMEFCRCRHPFHGS